METQVPLLNLTPVCLQKTDTILDTMLFMCLDQGHDFRDGSKRTLNKGKPSWVDLVFEKRGYLNKVLEEDYNKNYKSKTITSDKIFGNSDFIKGLINTTFSGGDGNYGLVVIDDFTYKKLDSDENKITELIENILKENITFNITKSIVSNYYYIHSQTDTKGGNGLTFENIGSVENTHALFLPFYHRVYNEGMHEL